METKIYHPKCKEIFGTIQEIENEMFPEDKFETTTFYGYKDWYSSFDEAKEYLQKDNEAEYNGSAQKHRASERAYEIQEKQALGNY